MALVRTVQEASHGSHGCLDQPGRSIQKLNYDSRRPDYVSQKHEWNRIRHVVQMLWPGMDLPGLTKTLEEIYHFRATWVDSWTPI